MGIESGILIFEAMFVYFLVLWTHSLRQRFGLIHFYALLGGLTALSWATQTGVSVQLAGISFVIGSTVFYTSLFLGIVVVYAFDGPRAAWMAISTIVGISILFQGIIALLHLQMYLIDSPRISKVPLPDLRVLSASVVTMIVDSIFLAVAWEYLGKTKLELALWGRAFLTLLGVMWLDAVLFATGAFAGTSPYPNILKGTIISRLVITLFAFPFLYIYLFWQSKKEGITIENRPILSILKQVAEIERELSDARIEIKRRKAAEEERDKVIRELQQAISEVKTLRGFLPICAYCHKIRDDKGYWNRIESYLHEHSEAELSHGICPECFEKVRAEAGWHDKL